MNRLLFRIRPALPLFTALLLIMFTAACTASQTGDAPTAAPGDGAQTDDQGALGLDAETDTDDPSVVRVKLTEFGIESPLDTFETGVTYTLILESAGELPHDFRITELGEAEAMVDMQTGSEPHTHGTELVMVPEADLAPGATFETEVTFMQPGEFEMACHVLGHFEAGMWLPIHVVGETLAMPTPIDPESITYDANAMAGMPCHAMGITIMGDCTEEDVERVKGEILAKSGVGAMMMSGEEDDHAHEDDEAHDDAGMSEDMEGMEDMMDEMMGGRDRIIIDLATRSDELCQIIEENTIIGNCSNEDLIRLIEEIKASRAQAMEGEDGMMAGEGDADAASEDQDHDDGDHGHEDDSGSDDSDG